MVKHFTIITAIATLATWIANNVTDAMPGGYNFVLCWLISFALYALYIKEKRSVAYRKAMMHSMDLDQRMREQENNQ